MDISQTSDDGACPEPRSKSMQYSEKSLRRAARAVRCSPFYPKLLAEMRVKSVGILVIAEDSGMLKGYTQQPLSEMGAEAELLWLVAVGILRREVDGQGLTDSFRLTPLGRQLVDRWQSQGCPDRRASLVDYVKNTVLRRLRIPDWLA